MRKLNVKVLVRAITIPVIILIIWQLAGVFGLVSKTVLPTPLDIFLAFQELIKTGELFGHLSISVFRAAAGFFIGGGLGIILGTIVGFSTRSEQYLDPPVQMLRTVPHLAVAPLFVLWFGFGETSKVLLIADGAFFPLYVNAFLGIRGVDSKLFDVARVLEFSKRKLITKLILPSALPNLFTRSKVIVRCCMGEFSSSRTYGIYRRYWLYDYGCKAIFKYRYRICRHNYLCICWEVF